MKIASKFKVRFFYDSLTPYVKCKIFLKNSNEKKSQLVDECIVRDLDKSPYINHTVDSWRFINHGEYIKLIITV